MSFVSGDIPAEQQALHEQNMAYLKEFNSGLYEVLSKHKPHATIISTPQGLNIAKDETLHYRGSVQDAVIAAEQFVKKPSRLLLGKPGKLESFADPIEGSFDWATQPYDDKAEDFHYGRYVYNVTKNLSEAGLTFGENYTAKEPFYVISYGVGSGLHMLTIIEALKPRLFLIADLDADGLFMTTFFVDWQKVTETAKEQDTTVRFVLNKDPMKLHEAIKGTIMTSSLLGLDGLHAYMDHENPALKKIFYELLDQKSANMVNFVGYLVDEWNMMKNSFRNLRHGNKRILSNAQVKLDKYPVLILGSGPSLEDNIEHVKRIRDRVIIISSGSNLKILLDNGIKPDFHCNLERARSIYQRHVELIEAGYDLSDIYAVMTTTIWPGIDEFFKDTVYFLRPALSPLGVFCDSLDQVLYNEGPQVANTAFSFARRLAAKKLYLLGVDLGTSDPKRPRATGAWQGIRPRHLSIPIRGNSGKTVFTDMQLIQLRDTLEQQVRKLVEVGGLCFNLGHGAKISGAPAAKIEDLDLPLFDRPREEIVKELFEQFPIYSRAKFETNWSSSVIREALARFVQTFEQIINSPGWTNKMVLDLENHCQYVNKGLREQYPPRLIRGSLLRMLMHGHGIVQRALNEEDREKLIGVVKETIIAQLRLIELEAYGLADELETEDEALVNS